MKVRDLTQNQAMRGFALGTVSYLAVFAAIGAPYPLFCIYQTMYGLSNADLSVILFVCLAGISLTLLIAGRLSDALGRKPVTIAALLLAAIGTTIFLFATSSYTLWLARLVHGLAAGLTLSAISSLVVDSISAYRLGWGTVVVGCATLFGLMLGSVVSAVCYEVTQSIQVIYLISILVLLVCAALVFTVVEPLEEKTTLRDALRLNLYIPRHTPLLFAAAVLIIATNLTVGGFFSAFAATAATENFYSDSVLLGSSFMVCSMGSTVLGGPLSLRLSSRLSLRLGAVCLVFALVGLAVALLNGFLALFMLSACLFGFSAGMGGSAIMRRVLVGVDASKTASSIATINFIGYVYSALIAVAAKLLPDSVSLVGMLFLYGFIAVLSLIVVFVYTVRNKQDFMGD